MSTTIFTNSGVYFVIVDLIVMSTNKTLVKLFKNSQKLWTKSQLSTSI